MVFIVKIGDEEKCVKPKYFDGWVGGMCRIYIREENGEIILDAQSDTILKNCYLYATDIIFNRIFGKPQLNYMPFPSIE